MLMGQNQILWQQRWCLELRKVCQQSKSVQFDLFYQAVQQMKNELSLFKQMNERNPIEQQTKNSDLQPDKEENVPIFNSFSKSILNNNKKYINTRKVPQTKNYSQKNTLQPKNLFVFDKNKSASVVNLQFAQGKSSQNIKGFHKKYNFRGNQQKKNNFNTLEEASKRLAHICRENNRTKYHQLFKTSLDDFFKSTLQIGPYAKSILKGKEVDENITQTRLINIEKVALPFRETKIDKFRNKTSYSQINQTTRIDLNSTTNKTHNRIKSFTSNNQFFTEQQTYSDRRPQSFQRKRQKLSVLQALIPVRKPNNKKDYFVFGLSDRTGTTENKIQMYRDLLWKVNYSNCLFVFTPENVNNPNQSYKFYVGPGNNCNLIKGILKRRFWWSLTTNKNEEGIHFLWTQLKINHFFKQQHSNQLPEAYKDLKQAVKNQRSESQSSLNHQLQPQFTDISKIFNFKDVEVWSQHYKKNIKSECMIQQNTYKKRMKLYQKKPFNKIDDSNTLRMHNHLQFNYYIGNKKAMFYNIKRFYELQNKNPFEIIPHTFHIKKGTDDPEWKNFLKYHEQMETYRKSQIAQKNQSFRNMWICKPGENTNRGNGITVCYSLDDIKIRLNGRQRNRDGQLRTFILQKYLQSPMLYQKRKFDIRHYALITCINGIFKFYWYEQGYIRTSSSQFSLKCNRDPLIHLTNDAIQKNTPDYGKYQKGNKLSYQDFQKYLDATFPTKKYNFFQQMLPRMKLYATEAFRASYSILDEKRLGHNFQLLGLDFMIDENFEPWLIEINTNPCLELSSPLLARIIPHLIENVCRICIDPLFPPPQFWAATKKPFFSEDPLSQNKFTLVFDEVVHGREIDQIFKDQKKIDVAMGKIEEQDETYEDEGKQDWEQKNINI